MSDSNDLIYQAQVSILRSALSQCLKALTHAQQFLDKDQQAEVEQMLKAGKVNVYVVYSTTACPTPGAVKHLVEKSRQQGEREGLWKAQRKWRQEWAVLESKVMRALGLDRE